MASASEQRDGQADGGERGEEAGGRRLLQRTRRPLIPLEAGRAYQLRVALRPFFLGGMSLTRAPKMLEDDLSSAERKRQIATGQQPALRMVDRRRKGICTLRARETVQKLSNFSAAVANCSRDRTAAEQTDDRMVKKCHSRRRPAGELDRFYGAPSAHLARARVPIGPSAARVKMTLKATCTNTPWVLLVEKNNNAQIPPESGSLETDRQF